ncbi:MAG: hypothetical protein U5L45_16365 [Saprospiraceae bacterium]|nr:hypothetical protein [Saprospiraceae bacterium]
MKNNASPLFSPYFTWLGHGTFAVLTVLSFVFFRERTVILDAALQSFIILRDNDFAIQVHRFGAAMTQVFPLVAARLGGSLSTILMVYSLSFVWVHWAMFWLCDRVLKQKLMAFAIVLFNVFMVNDTFYWAQNELIQAISLNFVFWAYLLNRGNFTAFRWFDYPLLGGLVITLAFFHPLIVFPFLFMAIYFLTKISDFRFQISKSNTTNEPPIFNYTPLSISLILTAFLCFLLVYTLKNQLLPNYYDPSARERLFLDKNVLFDFLLNIKNAPSFKDFLAHLWSDFALLPIFLGVLSVFYLLKKRILTLILVWLSVIAYTLMIVIAYREGGNWFHIESQYLPMSIFVIVPFICELLLDFDKKQIFDNPNAALSTSSVYFTQNSYKGAVSPRIISFGGLLIFLKKSWLCQLFLRKINSPSKKPLAPLKAARLEAVLFLIGFLLLYRLADIYQTHDFYTKRVAYIGSILEKTKQVEGTKFIIEERDIDKTPLIQTWGFAYETLYYSALQSSDSVRSITILVDSVAISKALNTSSIFQGIFTPTPYNQLNPRLFHQKDTVSFYKLLRGEDK